MLSSYDQVWLLHSFAFRIFEPSTLSTSKLLEKSLFETLLVRVENFSMTAEVPMLCRPRFLENNNAESSGTLAMRAFP